MVSDDSIYIFEILFSKFGSVVKGKPIYGANCKGIKKKSDVRYIRITDINEDGSLMMILFLLKLLKKNIF